MPYDVVSALGIREGDDVDFLKYNDSTFIFAKKSDLVNALTGNRQAAPSAAKAPAPSPDRPKQGVNAEELGVLKKLDTVRYRDRTRDSVHRLLDSRENAVLQGLLKRKAVTLFKKEGESEYRYGISKEVYNEFLYGKRGPGKPNIVEPERHATKGWTVKLKEQNRYAEELEANGYLVVPTEVEATTLSTLLEESIRLGLVIGTRAFNKKYYVALKSFVAQNANPVLKLIEGRGVGIADIARALKVEEDAARAVLYLLSESGEVTEVRRDVFKAA